MRSEAFNLIVAEAMLQGLPAEEFRSVRCDPCLKQHFPHFKAFLPIDLVVCWSVLMVWIASACREWSKTYQVGSVKLCPFDCCLSDLEGLFKAFLVLTCGKAVITDKSSGSVGLD